MSEVMEAQEPVENEPIETPETPAKSMDDTLAETLAAMNERDKEESPIEPAEEDEDAPEETPEEISETSEEPEEETEEIEINVPSSWRKEAISALESIPAEHKEAIDTILAEVVKREEDFHKGIEQFKEKAAYADSIGAVIGPYDEYIQSLGTTPEVAINALLAAEYTLRNGTPEQKAQAFQKLAYDYGIDIGPDGALNVGEVDQRYQMLQQQINNMAGQLGNMTQVRQNEINADAEQQINAFKLADGHEYFETVRDDMSRLLEAGAANSLDEAYDLACYRNPDIRKSMTAKQQQDAVDAFQKQKKEKAIEAKKAAAVNIKSGKNLQSSVKKASMEETIRETLKNIQAA